MLPYRSLPLALLLACYPVAALAQADSTVEPLEIVGAYTLVAQTADEADLDDSRTGSVDLTLGWSRRWGRIDGYIEGNTSLRDNGIATRIPESNADAGTALDADRSGRLQVSELKYSFTWADRRKLTAGLLDPSAYLDAARINNDENLQFLGAPFVNNPTIEFPDYTLGLAGEHTSADGRRTWHAVLTSSHGIADNPNLSYSQVLNFHADNKGLFAGTEVAWPRPRRVVRVGGWVHESPHESLDGGDDDATNYGMYTAAGASRGRTAANLRLGWANPDVSLAAGFAALSLQWEAERRVLGLAAARTWVSSRAPSPNAEDSLHLEAYLRFTLIPNLYLTPSVQYLDNSDFHLTRPADRSVVVFSLRLHHVFFERPAP